MSDHGEEEPDWTRSCSFSRRRALALGAAAMGGLAGCNSVSKQGETPATDVPDNEHEQERTITVRDASIDTVEFDVLLAESLREHDEVEFTARAYTSPNLDRENWAEFGKTTVTQSSELGTNSIYGDLSLGYAQNLRFTIEMLSPEERAAEDITIEWSPSSETEDAAESTGRTLVPFYNAARDTEMVLMEPPRRPQDDWAYSDPFYKTDFWFSSPDDSGFNTPSVPDDEYDQD